MTTEGFVSQSRSGGVDRPHLGEVAEDGREAGIAAHIILDRRLPAIAEDDACALLEVVGLEGCAGDEAFGGHSVSPDS